MKQQWRAVVAALVLSGAASPAWAQPDGVSAAFGEDNVVAAAHLREVTTIESPATVVTAGTGVSVLQFGAPGAAAIAPDAAVSTGSISNQTLGSLSGANMFVANTGLANQGDAIGVSASGSF